MSIAMCVIECNSILYIASDKRAIKGGIITDNYKKIYLLRDNLYFAMTGIAEAGLAVLEKIQRNKHLPIDDFLNVVDKEVILSDTRLTVMIAGLTERNDFFIWQKNHLGEIAIADVRDDNIAFSISSTDNIDKFNEYFARCYGSKKDIQYCISETIGYASFIDSSISPQYDLFIVRKKNEF